MKDKTVCFSGHRSLTDENVKEIEALLHDVIVALIECGYKYFGVGGALGFDTLAAKEILRLKGNYEHIKLILILPCRDQTMFWQKNDVILYDKIMHRADKIVYMSNYYCSDCMHKRNRHMVENSSVLVCFLSKKCGGTYYTVKYAESCGLKVINLKDLMAKNYINPQDFNL